MLSEEGIQLARVEDKVIRLAGKELQLLLREILFMGFWKTIPIFAAPLILLSGCSALQYARYHTPSFADNSIKTVPNGDGIAFRLPEACVGIYEGMSAYRNPLFIGPLVFTVFPLGIFTPVAKDSNYLWLDIHFKPNVEGLTFAPERVHAKFNDGSTLSPAAFAVWHIYSPPGPIQFIGASPPQPIKISTQTSVISLRFDKVDISNRANSVLVEGLLQDGKMVKVPQISFHFGSEFRMILPGYSADNRKYNTFDNSCAALGSAIP